MDILCLRTKYCEHFDQKKGYAAGGGGLETLRNNEIHNLYSTLKLLG